jgi:hypothetical protein
MRGAFRHYISTGGNGQPDHLRSRSRLGLSANTREPTDAFIQTTSFAREKNAIPTTLPDQAGALTPPASPAHGETTDGPGAPLVGAIFNAPRPMISAFGS